MFLSNVHRPLFFGLTRIYSLFIATFFAFIVKFRMHCTGTQSQKFYNELLYSVGEKKKISPLPYSM